MTDTQTNDTADTSTDTTTAAATKEPAPKSDKKADATAKKSVPADPSPSFAELTHLLPDDDSVHEKYRGKSVADLSKAYTNAQSLIGRKDDQIKQLESQVEEWKGKADKQFKPPDWQQISATIYESEGLIPDDILDSLSEGLNINRSHLARLLKADYDANVEYDNQIKDAIGMSSRELMEHAEKSKLFTEADLDAFQRVAAHGSIAPFETIKAKLVDAGILEADPADEGVPGLNAGIQPGNSGPYVAKKQPTRGRVGAKSDAGSFKSKADYDAAMAKAHNIRNQNERHAAIEQIAERLKATPNRNW